MLLKQNYNISIDYATLNSYRETMLDETIISKLRLCQIEVDEILQNVIVIDDVYNPTGIFKKCKEYAEKWGKVRTNENTITDYVADNEEEYVLVVVDHVSLLSTESGLNKHQTMSKWSDYVTKFLTKRFNWAVWNVQQTNMTSESYQRKESNTLEPSVEDLGDNKLLARDKRKVNINLILIIWNYNKKVVY
jgi:hypothetical protein